MIKYYNELDDNNRIQIYPPFCNVKEEYEIPNAYYINSDGLLYNYFGKNGHKEANLIYTYKLIKDSFYDIKHVSLNSDYFISLENILKNEMQNYKRILNSKSVNREDVMNYLHLNCCGLDNNLLVKLIIGIISSKILLLEKFIELQNTSQNKKNDIEKIISQSNDDINDILVRYCGFHKIESQANRTITTSSLNLNNFREYLDRDFNICVIPKILLNREYDEFYETIVIDRFLDKNPQYNDKIKRLVMNKVVDSNE